MNRVTSASPLKIDSFDALFDFGQNRTNLFYELLRTSLSRLPGVDCPMALLIFDMGMHKGEDTDFYLKLGYDVVAFEANPDLVSKCKSRFDKEIIDGRLRIVEGAIAPASAGETVTFFQSETMSIWGTINQNWVKKNAELGHKSNKITVSRIDIAETFSSLRTPEYIKIDIEGADTLALEALSSLPNKPQFISMEAEKNDFAALTYEINFLLSLGYQRFKAVQQQTIPGTKFYGKTTTGKPILHVFEDDASGPFGEQIPQEWMSSAEILVFYKGVFRLYKLFGDRSRINKLPLILQRALRGIYRLFTGYRGPLPGWYDTHASK